MTQQRIKVGEDGSVVLPAEVVREMGLAPGEAVGIRIETGRLSVERLPEADQRARDLEEAQRIMRRYREAGYFGDGSLADELIADRRREALLD